jgi:hypothetical protein
MQSIKQKYSPTIRERASSEKIWSAVALRKEQEGLRSWRKSAINIELWLSADFPALHHRSTKWAVCSGHRGAKLTRQQEYDTSTLLVGLAQIYALEQQNVVK